MSFLCPDTGRLRFEDGFCLEAGMPAGEILPGAAAEETLLCLPARPVRGGALAAICELEAGGLVAVTLHVASVGLRADAGTDRRRAFLFRTLGLRDPYPDTRRGARVSFPFGEAFLSTDAYTGGTTARLEYRRQPKERIQEG